MSDHDEHNSPIRYWPWVVAFFAVILGRLCFDKIELSIFGTYTSFAHIWLGFMFAIALLPRFTRNEKIAAWVMIIVATAVEVFKFFS